MDHTEEIRIGNTADVFQNDYCGVAEHFLQPANVSRAHAQRWSRRDLVHC